MDRTWVEHEFDRRAATYDDSDMHHSLAQSFARFTRVVDADRVLDVATGTGLVLRAMTEHPAARMTGVDLSERMLEVAASFLPESRWVRADAAELPFSSAEFDLVTCAAALPYLPDVDSALMEFKRVLAEGGRIVLSAFVTDGITGPALVREAAIAHDLIVEDPNRPWGSIDALRRLASRSGLRVRRSELWSTPLSPVDADSLLSARYPLARDDVASATPQQLDSVRSTLTELVRATSHWEAAALIVELVAADAVIRSTALGTRLD